MDIAARVIETKPDAIRLASLERPACAACRTLGGCLGDTYHFFAPLLRTVGWVSGYDFPCGATVMISVPDVWPLYLLFFSLFLPTVVLVFSAVIFSFFSHYDWAVVFFSLLCCALAVFLSPYLFSRFVAVRQSDMRIVLTSSC